MNTHDGNSTQAHNLRDRAAQKAECMQAHEHASESLSGPQFPPSYNMGDTEPLNHQKQRENKENNSFRFDWYQATLEPEVEPVQVLRWAQFFGDPSPMKAINGYDRAHDFGQLKVLYGGHSGKYGVHVIIHGGDACHAIVESFREKFPDHRPTRFDVCMDFVSPIAWDQLSRLGARAAKRYEIQTDTQGDWLDARRGRTLYIGGKQSIFRARIYEKGHEMRAKGKILDAPLDWVRLEFQVRPPKHNRHLAASMTADQVARSGRWNTYICDALDTMQVPVVRLNTRRPAPAVVDSFECMAAQYVGVIGEIKRDQWMTFDQYMAVMAGLWESGRFNGLPEEIIREWYF